MAQVVSFQRINDRIWKNCLSFYSCFASFCFIIVCHACLLILNDGTYIIYCLTSNLILIISWKYNFWDFSRFLFQLKTFSFIPLINPQSNLILHFCHLIAETYLEVLRYNVWLVVKEALSERLLYCSQLAQLEDYNAKYPSQL